MPGRVPVDDVHVTRGGPGRCHRGAGAEGVSGGLSARWPRTIAPSPRAGPTGFVKLIAAPRRFLRNAGGGQIVGATIVGERAGEMIHEPAMAMLTNMFTGRLAQLAHAYPTWSLGVQKAAGQFFQEIEGRTARPARRG